MSARLRATGDLRPSVHADEARRALAQLDRRGFLRASALAAAAGLLPACRDAQYAPDPSRPLRVLDPRGYGVLTAAAMAVAGPELAALVRARAIDPAAAVDAFLVRSPDLAAPLATALLALEYAVFPFVPKLRPFTSLDEGGRAAVLRDLMTSRIDLKRILFNSVKSLSLLGIYSSREARDAIGYPLGDGAARAGVHDAMTYEVDLPTG